MIWLGHYFLSITNLKKIEFILENKFVFIRELVENNKHVERFRWQAAFLVNNGINLD